MQVRLSVPPSREFFVSFTFSFRKCAQYRTSPVLLQSIIYCLKMDCVAAQDNVAYIVERVIRPEIASPCLCSIGLKGPVIKALVPRHDPDGAIDA